MLRRLFAAALAAACLVQPVLAAAPILTGIPFTAGGQVYSEAAFSDGIHLFPSHLCYGWNYLASTPATAPVACSFDAAGNQNVNVLTLPGISFAAPQHVIVDSDTSTAGLITNSQLTSDGLALAANQTTAATQAHTDAGVIAAAAGGGLTSAQLAALGLATAAKQPTLNGDGGALTHITNPSLPLNPAGNPQAAAVTSAGAYVPPNINASGRVTTKIQIASSTSTTICPPSTTPLTALRIQVSVSGGLGLSGQALTSAMQGTASSSPDLVLAAGQVDVEPVPASNAITFFALQAGYATCIQDKVQ